MKAKVESSETLQEQTLATIILEAEVCGMRIMGDKMIGYKFVDGYRENNRVWNLILEKFIPDGFEFTEDFFECYGITPSEYNSQKWNHDYGTEF